MGGNEFIDDEELLIEEEAQAMRKTVRKRVLWKARLEVAGVTYACAVVDLSLGGARLHFAEPVESGTKVRLILDRFGAFSAAVVWQKGRGIGVRFTDDPQRIADLIGARLPLDVTKAVASA
ncbi:MAG TPA: PilZ domain-containing protein [Stellaceae bacterium]|nr:PilZ domain-containing protein [Stellaceae bacterium]